MSEIYLKAKEYYLNNNISLTKLSKMFKIDRGNFSKFLKNNGVEIINKQNQQTIIGNYFEKIDSEEKAYWLGFMYADGNVSKNSNNIEISLKPGDINHLRKFAKTINFTNKISVSNTRCRLCFANKQMKQDLINNGCIPAKSLILKYPKINNNLIIHFIRGYFDGDGCITFNQNKHHRPTISILGTKDTLDYISKNLTGHVKKLRGNHGSDVTFVLEYTGQLSRDLLFKLYENSNIYLDRKFERFSLLKLALQDRKVLDALSKYGRTPKQENTVVS